MKKSFIQVITLAAGFFLMASNHANADAKKHSKAEMVKEMLREKSFHKISESDNDPEEVRERMTTFDQRLTRNPVGASEAEVSIAVSPNDSSHLVASCMAYTSASSPLAFPIYYSSNGGTTWTQATFNSVTIHGADFPGMAIAGGGDPVFAWDKNGRLYFGWIYLSANFSSLDTAYFTLNWAYSDDNGATWNIKPNHFVGRGVLNASTGDVYNMFDGITDREWFAVDNSGGAFQGHLYSSFVCFPPGSAAAYEGVKTLVPGVDTFGAAVHAYNGSSQFGNVEVDRTGRLHMSFADLDSNFVGHVSSTDGGATFGAATVVGRGSVLFPQSSTFVFHNRENAAVNMAVDGATGTGNNVHVVWSDFPSGPVAYSCYAHSTDGGATWSTPDTLNNYFGGKSTLMPTVAAEGNNVAISFTANTGVDSAWYYHMGSTDNGSTFTGPVLASALPTRYHTIGANSSSSNLFFGDYNRSVRKSCQVYALWSDGRTSRPLVYFAKQDFCRLGINELTAINSGIKLVNIYPNPAVNDLTLKIESHEGAKVSIDVLDMNGKLLMSQKEQISKGTNMVTIPVNALHAGNYVVSVNTEAGQIATRVITIQ